MHFLRDNFNIYEGQGTLFGSIGGSDFRSIRSVVAPKDVVIQFEAMSAPLDRAIEANEMETTTLNKVRDLLLPKLLSGEIRVGQAEKIAEEHL
jgi:type I restriction enzyme, S subunit